METTTLPVLGQTAEERRRRTKVDHLEELRYPTARGLAWHGRWLHSHATFLAYQSLRRHFRGRDDLFVAQSHCVYYRRGKEEKRLIPDLIVVLGVPQAPRPVYKVWDEGGWVPDFVLEVSSYSTMHRDKGFKKGD